MTLGAMDSAAAIDIVPSEPLPDECPDLFLGNVLGAFARALSDKMDGAARIATSLSNSACYAIVTIGTEPDSSIETLRRMLSLEHSSLVRLLNRLEKSGLLLRRRGIAGDQREVRISLTELGEEYFSRILAARHKILKRLVERLDDEERVFVARLMQRLMPAVVACGDDQHYVCRLCDPDSCPQEYCPVNLAYPENFELPERRREALSQ